MIDYIRTYSGVKFHTVETSPADVKIEDIARVLSRAPRWGGHTKRPYPVAAHCLFVAKLMPRSMILDGLLHDASEAYIGDMPSPFKTLLPDYRYIEARITKATNAAFGLKYLSDPAVKSAVKFADAIALYQERIVLFDIPVGTDVPVALTEDPAQQDVIQNWDWDFWTGASADYIEAAFLKKYRTYKNYYE